MRERRLLQVAVILGALVPVLAGSSGVILGPRLFHDTLVYIPLDNHFRYLSGLLLAIGFGFLSCVRNIEHKTGRVRLLGGLVVVGGLARAIGVVATGYPGLIMIAALVMELVITPALCVWQARVARKMRAVTHPFSTPQE